MPDSLEAALCCLGLLAQPAHGCTASRGGDTVASRLPQPAIQQQQFHLQQQLHAVQVVVAAKRNALISAELLPLVQRLRQVLMHLEFHQVSCLCSFILNVQQLLAFLRAYLT
jgi:hypothetical protein